VEWYGKADGDYKKIKAIYEDFRKNLDKRGYGNAEIWVTEMGTYSGKPKGRYDWPFQTERQQAADILRRYVYSLSLGIKKVFWGWSMMEGWPPHDDNHFFDHTGLVYDGKKLSKQDVDRGRGVKKLGFYAYKLMTEKLEGSDWDAIERIHEKEDIYIYKFNRQGKYIWVAWNDNTQEKQVTISGMKRGSAIITEAVPRHNSGKDVRNVDTAFKIQALATQNEKVSFNLGQIPVFIEEQ
jgi:hypothetical protein